MADSSLSANFSKKFLTTETKDAIIGLSNEREVTKMIYYVTYKNAMGFIFRDRMNVQQLANLRCNQNFTIVSIS